MTGQHTDLCTGVTRYTTRAPVITGTLGCFKQSHAHTVVVLPRWHLSFFGLMSFQRFGQVGSEEPSGRYAFDLDHRTPFVHRVSELKRCDWASLQDPIYREYHDREWGVPVHDDRTIFEFLVLEGAQAGLSWGTILRKRENFRRAFKEFDPAKVARFDGRTVRELLQNPGIIRNRLKIDSAVQNARAFLEVQREFGTFDYYIWTFVGGKPRVNRWKTPEDIPAATPESEAMSKDLIRRGFRFVGPTICYAHMQATGMVNDHLVSCFRYREL